MTITGHKANFMTIAQVALELAERDNQELDAIERELEAGRERDALTALKQYFQRRKQPIREKAIYDRENENKARA